MRKFLWRFGAIVMILAGTTALSANPACGEDGCDKCGWECVGIRCSNRLGAQFDDVCKCTETWCDTVTEWDCPPD